MSSDANAFLLVAKEGDADRLTKLLAQGIDSNTRSDEEAAMMCTSLDDYVEYHDSDTGSVFEIDLLDFDRGTALITAAKHGNHGVGSLLLTHGADPNKHTKDGETALVMAAEYEHDEIVRLLLTNEADRNVQRRDGMTALLIAAEKGKEDIVSLLLINGADRQKKDENEWAALMMAVQNGHGAVINTLLHSHAEHFNHYSDIPREVVGDETVDTAMQTTRRVLMKKKERP